ncbi:B-cell receptor CD22-like isoform X2 [Pleurodeles waltl]|uniref:B-cell receptor CD22-like isoform X2 n=1 Tax=Pleurodeles waltl TaxID=8319 RepID=UPI0037098345
MFWTLLLALSALQCGLCHTCTVKYLTRTPSMTSTCMAIRCRNRCPLEHQVQATIWTKLKGPRDRREYIVYHTQKDLIDPFYRGKIEFLGDMKRDCTVRINDLRSWGEGNYRFTVVTDVGTFSTQEEVHLDYLHSIYNRAGFCQLHIISPQDVQEGKKAVWTCFSRNCGSRTHPQWFDSKGELITKGTSRQESGQNISLSITLTVEDHQRSIRCSAYEDASRTNCLVTSVTQIHVKRIPKGIRAILLTASKNGIQFGDTVSMRCMVTSSYPFISGYTWYKDGYEIHTQSMSDLMMENLKATDLGNYSCVAHNAIGSSLSSPPIKIDVNDIPKGIQAILLPASKNGIKFGDTVSMRCTITSSYPFVSGYTWYKDGYEIHTQSMSDLMLENLKATDLGNYSCVAHNAIGSSLSSPPIKIDVNDGLFRNGHGLKRSNSALWTGISLAMVVTISIVVAVLMWRYLKNKRKGNATGSTEVQVQQRSNHDGGIYENVDDHYIALDQSQISPEYEYLQR